MSDSHAWIIFIFTSLLSHQNNSFDFIYEEFAEEENRENKFREITKEFNKLDLPFSTLFSYFDGNNYLFDIIYSIDWVQENFKSIQELIDDQYTNENNYILLTEPEILCVKLSKKIITEIIHQIIQIRDTKYSLKGVVYHSGPENGGHYKCSLLMKEGQLRHYININDSEVEKTQKFQTLNAYLIFYEKQ
jgi:hypothetical protein